MNKTGDISKYSPMNYRSSIHYAEIYDKWNYGVIHIFSHVLYSVLIKSLCPLKPKYNGRQDETGFPFLLTKAFCHSYMPTNTDQITWHIYFNAFSPNKSNCSCQ